MYVVKVGEYYVRGYEVKSLDMCVLLSKELMRTFNKEQAENLAKKVNGEVIEMAEQVTMNDEKYKQLSIFDDEVANANN